MDAKAKPSHWPAYGDGDPPTFQRFVTFRLPAFHANLRKRLVKMPKLYFYDTGLVCRLLGIRAPDFEEALKRHTQWARQQNSDWGWNVFEIRAGKRVGNYVFVSGDRSWENHDENQEFETRAMARWRAEVSTHVESVQGGIYRSMADYSRIPENLDAYPFAVMSVFSMLPTSTRSFRRSLRKVTDAMKTQESAPPALWFQQESGGEQGTFMKLNHFRNWTDWPKEASAKAMAGAIDPEKTNAIVNELAKVILREETSVIALRPDLSFRP